MNFYLILNFRKARRSYLDRKSILVQNLKISFNACDNYGTPTKRQVTKRQVSKRQVSKRPVYKTSGLQNVRFT